MSNVFRDLRKQYDLTECEMNSKIDEAERLVRQSAQRRARLEEFSDMRSPTPGRLNDFRSPSPQRKTMAKSSSLGDLTEDIEGGFKSK